MAVQVLRFFGKQVAIAAIAATGVGFVIGTIKTIVEVLHGHQFWVSLEVGLVFFLIGFVCIVVLASAAGISLTLRRAKKLGVTMKFICDLPPAARKEFLEKNGF